MAQAPRPSFRCRAMTRASGTASPLASAPGMLTDIADAAPLLRHDHLRAARQGVHRTPPRGAGRPARQLRRAGARGRDRAPGRPRSDRGRAAARAPERARVLPGRAGLTNYWGYNTIGYFAP